LRKIRRGERGKNKEERRKGEEEATCKEAYSNSQPSEGSQYNTHHIQREGSEEQQQQQHATTMAAATATR
jgi:hypothetical protein